MSACFFLFVVVALVAAGGGCDFADPISTPVFQALIKQIHDQGFSSDKLKVLRAFAGNNTLGFTSDQTVTLLAEFSFSSDRTTAISIVSNFILTLDCDGIAAILKSLSFSSDKMPTLKILVTLANEVDLKLNKEKVIDCFSFSSDKAEARRIIETAKARSCLFGPSDIPIFAFIIDVSGSMAETFKDDDGTVYSRLGYVQRDLIKVMNSTLQPTQRFNIISFSNAARAWQPGVVPVNAGNVASAGNFVRALVASGGTYMLNALKLAFQDTNVMGVYFLSDGDPSDDKASILRFIQGSGKPVNTIAFKAPPTGAQFLLQMANTTKGSFRNIV